MLRLDTIFWKSQFILALMPEETLPELRPVQLSLTIVKLKNGLLDRYSKWERLVRATAWVLKFIQFLRLKRCKQGFVKYLTVSDFSNAELWLIRCAQKDEFEIENKALTEGKNMSRNSKLKGLSPFINTDNLIVVGGRLHNSTLSNEQKHPIILPFGHKVTRLIFIYYHEILLHGGPQLLLAEIRLRFWPIKGRIAARSTALRCVTCVRSKPKFVNPIMGILLSPRVHPFRPFSKTGVDFAGPLNFRSGIRRVTSIKSGLQFLCA